MVRLPGINCPGTAQGPLSFLYILRILIPFSPTRLSGPSWSSSCNECLFLGLSVCLSGPFSCNFFCVVGLVQSVPRPWTGAILILIPSRAPKTRMCSGVWSWSHNSWSCFHLFTQKTTFISFNNLIKVSYIAPGHYACPSCFITITYFVPLIEVSRDKLSAPL